MGFYTPEELRELLADDESDLVERKRTAADRSAIRRSVCAFANDLPGHARPGVIFIGLEDDGRCAGIEVDDELLRTLAQMRADGNILPLPSMRVEKLSIEDCTVVAIQVEPSISPPVRYQGRVWVRVGPTVQLASPEEELRLAERRRSADMPFDLRPALSAALDELDYGYIQNVYLPAAVSPEVLERNHRPLSHQLHALRLAVGEHPSWGGLIACARDPQGWVPGAYVQFLRIDGVRLTDPIKDQKSLTGKLEDVLRRLDELLALHIMTRSEITRGPREQRHPDYPIVALQQLTRNAIMHRSYEGTHAPVRVYWYADRVEIQNPGGLYGKVTAMNFGSGATDYRNPLIAEIMHHLGYAQRFGLGIPLARQALTDNGNPPPDFSFTPTHVAVTVRPAP